MKSPSAGRTFQPLLIHHHIAKTAGTSLSSVLQANYRRGQYVNLDRLVRRDPTRSPGDLYGGLSDEQRGRIRCIEGLTAQFLIPVVTDRRAQAICLLRDPSDRVISLYLYLSWRYEKLGERDRAARVISVMRRNGWSLKDVYLDDGLDRIPVEERELFQIFFDGQAKEVLAAFVDRDDLRAAGERSGIDRFRKRAFEVLSEHYLVGTQDRFSQSIRMFAESFGWQRMFVPIRRVNPYRGLRDTVDEETRELIRAHNALDADLHAHFSERLRELPPVSPWSQRRWRVRHHLGRTYRRLRRRWRT